MIQLQSVSILNNDPSSDNDFSSPIQPEQQPTNTALSAEPLDMVTELATDDQVANIAAVSSLMEPFYPGTLGQKVKIIHHKLVSIASAVICVEPCCTSATLHLLFLPLALLILFLLISEHISANIF